ncbi:cytochrome c oxidase subunit I [Anoxybacillus sp. LAT_35]|uniref:cytochrome c oxidase subunit I n=1 Tax=Anoxybacillus TaxID=150247 RepID=UPI001EDAE0C5|nr:cytochrome c oxidase subunit I [Anoxybacillus sp. LAT_26]MCG3085241.1 cytochrome c oxidase subunit I [Anoxybacillus sp. LAT27]MCG5025896.1 cytochrome c oxidase subunit I [Anoxybacillus flavithermus]MCG6172401.1 cytochrome c oxidase subunit I [Anoxybacillus sp. LAT_11]MCG6175137.1 cytochrome c oxidase subunit I [Anoxybacillus sp. LAT_31]MCG6177903.1 cytochrome c oxidase subunit I [Anoxybacillus sp. LAT_35]MCG6180869.1 cytochrome c oxidase subunit I [Anoxybacillus sp. LAT_33]MCG6195783.1 cy
MSTLARKKGVGAVIWDYLTTVDHKKIAILYLIAGGVFFLLGGLEAMIIRIQLAVPNNDFISAGFYNEVLTMHGTTMIFLAAMPLVFAMMNAVVPIQIGARDVAFPFLNALGFWLFFFGGVFLNLSWFLGGAPDAGWTSYASLSLASPTHGIDFYVLGLQISGFGTLIGGINFLVTIINMRAPGMTYMRMPMFTWATFVTSALILFAFPPLTVGLIFMMMDRLFGGNFFDPALGGNTIIWEHLFWIFGHPEVYILVLPAFGIFSEIFATFSRKRLFGYSSMVFATVLIGFLGFMVWAHHMFTVGMGPIANAIFAVATMAIAVPTGIKIFNWLFTMWGGSIRFTTPMMYAVAFIPSFVIGGVTGVMNATAAADYQYHDSYFVVAHFHYVIVGGVVFALLAGAHYWWPKMFGKMLDEKLGKVTFWLFFTGFHLTFFIQHFLGLMGMPRRVFTFLPGQGFETGNMISTIGAFFMAAGTIVLLANVVITTVKGKRVGNDPWEDGRTLEWAVSSPAPEYNFAQTPLVRGLDAYWIEKMEGKKGLTPAEPLGDIHMPNPSFLPFVISLGLFVAAFGFLFHNDHAWGTPVGVVGLLITLGAMFFRSIIDDHGFHIHKEEVMEAEKKGAGA